MLLSQNLETHHQNSRPDQPLVQGSRLPSRYTLIVQAFENMLTILRQSNAQDEHDPTFVEMIKQCTTYEDLLEKAVSEFGSLPYCDTPGFPVHETLPSSSVKS
ncbi:hypothetical protein TNCV_1909611 [Trichonephila clavipes]|nr:hypothetical protein TNCV_1909611 [Trichonephila clavipes]